MDAQEVADDLMNYSYGAIPPKKIIEKYGLDVKMGDSVAQALLLKFASHVTASLETDIANELKRWVETVAVLTKERDQLQNKLHRNRILREEIDKVMLEEENRAEKAEARVESLTQEKDAFALQLKHLREYFDRAVTQESALRGRVESLEKALREIGVMIDEPTTFAINKLIVLDKVRGIARKALQEGSDANK